MKAGAGSVAVVEKTPYMFYTPPLTPQEFLIIIISSFSYK
jgi:hypothetical protein